MLHVNYTPIKLEKISNNTNNNIYWVLSMCQARLLLTYLIPRERQKAGGKPEITGTLLWVLLGELENVLKKHAGKISP